MTKAKRVIGEARANLATATEATGNDIDDFKSSLNCEELCCVCIILFNDKNDTSKTKVQTASLCTIPERVSFKARKRWSVT